MKNPPYKQIILEIILTLSRLLQSKLNFFCIDNWNCFNMLLYFVERKILRNICQQEILRITIVFHFSFSQSFSCEFVIFPELAVFSRVGNFLLIWEFSLEFRTFSQIENFLMSWQFSPEVRIFSRIENFLPSWEFFLKLIIFS